MDFDTASPIWQQLVDEFVRRIVTGQWQPGEKLPSTRDLAFEYKVNPNTVQRALAELDRRGHTRSERTAGRFVSEDTSALQHLQQESAHTVAQELVEKLRGLGLSKTETVKLIETLWETS